LTFQVADSTNRIAVSQALSLVIVSPTIFSAGESIALDADGSIAVVGNGSTGLATVFQRDAQGNWSQATQLSNTDKGLASVAISGDGGTIVVGSCANAVCQGHGFVYVATDNTATPPRPDWTLALKTTATLSASNAQAKGGDRIGLSVATDGNGDTVAVGAPCDFTAANLLCGTVYVYSEPAAGWSSKPEDAQLTVSQTPTVSLSLSMDEAGQTIVAGSPGPEAGNNTAGAVFVFAKPSTGWQTTAAATATLTEPLPTNGDSLGWSTAISADGHTVVGGAYNFAGCSPQPCHSGAAFVFVNPGAPSVWASKPADATLEAQHGSDKDAVGFSATISGDGSTIVAGASGFGVSIPGKAYVFQRPPGGWLGLLNETQGLSALSGTAIGGQSVTPAESFGTKISISADGSTLGVGGLATVGTTANQGVVYVFQ